MFRMKLINHKSQIFNINDCIELVEFFFIILNNNIEDDNIVVT
jgi:hypothetical protein